MEDRSAKRRNVSASDGGIVAKQRGSSTSTSPNVNSSAYFMVYAMIAGIFGALSGVAGKLSVTDSFSLEVYVRIGTFLANGFCTAQMWRYYLKALALGPTPTCQILNTGTNFLVSAIVGLALFGEALNAMWCVGAVLVVVGLGVIASDPGVPIQS